MPDYRFGLDKVNQDMIKAKTDILALPPFSYPNPNVRINYAQVGAKTQHSVFLQKEIEQFTTELTTGKNLTNPGNVMMTYRVHDQRTGPYFLTRNFFNRNFLTHF